MTFLKRTLVLNDKQHDVDVQLIGKKLNSLIEKTRTTPKILSSTTGVSIAGINKLRRGEGNPTIGTLNSIANFFNISIVELLGMPSDTFFEENVLVSPVFDLRVSHLRESVNLLFRKIIDIPKSIDRDNVFCISLSNDYLSPLYDKDTIFVIICNQPYAEGDLALVRVKNEINKICRLHIKKDLIFLENLKASDEIESYSKKEIEIIGIVNQIIQKPYYK